MVARCKCAIELEDIHIEDANDNLITRIQLSRLPLNITDYKCAGGEYFEYSTENINDVVSIVSEKFQTLSYLGMDSAELRKFVLNNGLSGTDRIVPVGKTSDFSLVWDGYDPSQA